MPKPGKVLVYPDHRDRYMDVTYYDNARSSEAVYREILVRILSGLQDSPSKAF